MRKLILTTILTGLMGASVALAIPSSGTISLIETPGHQYSNGGQFTATVGSESFQTFCIEIYYEFSPGLTYSYVLGQDTHGAPPGTAAPHLNLGAAWLFAQFTAGDFGILSPIQAGELQCALWYFQGQGANPNGAFSGPGFGDGLPTLNAYTDAADTALWGMGLDPLAASAGRFGVDIIESTDKSGRPAQDWLHVPDGGTTIMLLGFGLTGLALVSRRLGVAK